MRHPVTAYLFAPMIIFKGIALSIMKIKQLHPGGQKQTGRFVLALLSGLLLFFSSPGSGGHALLAWVALAPLLLAILGLNWRRAALLGLVAGMIYHLPLLYWITIVLGDFGGVHAAVAAMALALLALYMSLYPAIFAGLLVTLTTWGDPRARLGALWAAPVLWVGLDVVRARLFTGFPWQDLGYSQYQLPLLTQVADLGGHHLITFSIVLSSTLLALLTTIVWQATKNASDYGGQSVGGHRVPQVAASGTAKRTSVHEPARSPLSAVPCDRLPKNTPVLSSRASLALALVLLALVVFYGMIRLQQWPAIMEAGSGMEVGVVQGNISQDEKWDYDRQITTVEDYLKLSNRAAGHRDGPPELIVWPETALPFYPLEHSLFDEVTAFAARHDTCLLTGAPHREWEEDDRVHYYNSALLVSPDEAATQPAGIYRKQHLVPFGEYIPMRRLLPFFAPVVETLGDFTPGSEPTLLTCGNRRLGALICFEAIFPRLARQMTSEGADLLINITNDAWFGQSNAPSQHLSMSALRAVENRRSMARAANTGISAFVTPDGRIHQATELFTPDQRRAALPLPNPAGNTFSIFTAGGFLFGPACLLLLITGIIRHIYVNMRS